MNTPLRIFPPVGDKDSARFAALEEKDRSYRLFCLEFCDQVLVRQPNHLEALDAAASHLTALGYFQDGLALDYRLAALRPTSPGVLYNLSCSLALLNRRDEALDALEKAVWHGYDDLQHMASDRDLASLHDDRRFSDLLARSAPARHDPRGGVAK